MSRMGEHSFLESRHNHSLRNDAAQHYAKAHALVSSNHPVAAAIIAGHLADYLLRKMKSEQLYEANHHHD